MALNLSTLTSSATSGDVLQEVLTTADFLEPCPVLRNLSRGSNKGGDAKQDVALNQPRSLPLIKNPQGKLGGYLYIPNVSGNYATGPSVTIGANQTWQAEVDVTITQFGSFFLPMGGGDWATGFGLIIYDEGSTRVFSKGINAQGTVASGINLSTPTNIKYGYNGTNLFIDVDGVRKYEQTAPSQSGSITHAIELNQQTRTQTGNYAIQKAKLTVNSAVVFDCDFNGSTSIRHGDTKFQASVGGPVSLTRASNDPVTVVKKSVLRFDGVNDSLQGLFANNIDGGYMFAAFSVLGDGGGVYGRVLSVNNATTPALDYNTSGGIFSLHNNPSPTTDLSSFYNSAFLNHSNMFDPENGDILHEVKIQSGSNLSRVNQAGLINDNRVSSINSDVFNISQAGPGGGHVSLDLEYLAVFPATITDAQADSVRNYINNRNNVFDLKDGFGYYFYDAQKAPVGAISSGSNAWSGRIVGSDNGDSASIEATQSTANDQPVSDGFKVTFADNTDHLDIPQVTLAAGDSSAWMVCGTSLGTFAYKVTVSGQTELSLLGHVGYTGYRKAGDLYGIILLPKTTGADIEAARKLLIDRGAADGTTAGSIRTDWYNRDDIVEFKHLNTSSVTASDYAWYSCQALEKFPALDLSNSTTLSNAWFGCTALSDFGAIQADSCGDFSSAWQGTSALTSFPAGAKLGTSASNVNFTSAWQGSGLNSFSTPLPTASRLFRTWQSCTTLTSFSSDLSLATNAFAAWRICTSLTSFNAALPLATDLRFAFDGCSSLPSFDVSLPVAVKMDSTWLNCSSLTDFSADVFSNWNPSSISSGVFNNAWDNCTSLTAQSVENILTSIDASGKYATTTGASGGSALGDAGIDIDYNTATGSLSAATNTAVTSLKAKGWSIIVNNVTL